MKPPKRELRRLYERERLSTYEIGDIYGVNRVSVGRWLRAYGIPLRPPGTGLVARGQQPLTAAELHDLVHVQHLSYVQIAERYGVDGSAIGHWLMNAGISRPKVWETRRKGQVVTLPTREELQALYVSGESIVGIGRRFGVSELPIRRLMREYDIAARAGGWRGALVCADGHVVRSTYERRVDDWLSAHDVLHEYEPRLPFDRRYRADFLANGWYIEVWGVKNVASYTRRRNRKCAAYAAAGLPLIELGTHAFGRPEFFKRRLGLCLRVPEALPIAASESPKRCQ